MMQAVRKDRNRINEILGHDSVWPWISDDNTPKNVRYTLGQYFMEEPGTVVLHPNEYSVFIFRPVNSVTYEAHTNILPSGRGVEAIGAGKGALKWMFKNTPCQKVITWVPVFNRMASIFARMCGLKREGNATKSYLKDGELHDQILLGITKEEFMKCQ